MSSHFTVVYDACVLYPAPLRDLLMHLAMSNLFRASLPQLQQMDPAAAEARVQRVVEDARARVRAEIRRR